ncbi:uncharacterized protein BJ171DRAFT_515029 [Polychytrium aggregatum]|uniref:uncharacterized protein n=1 Tax=Polychytrium aggregatum TaxID=110093 RepID=UPI0022FDF201|nr:uncharacterized protein BJ171DRAFT_515029 [Polychytrium aggregatum]KAI9202149.1 hypothetical protein BJ171DRAFT_515029 [Polychytrium aggregatum]
MQDTTLTLPTVDLTPFLSCTSANLSPEAMQECRSAAESLLKYSILILRDPRVSESDNDRFLNLMEAYFDQPLDLKMLDVRPELGYQVGATPERTELPVCGRDPECLKRVEALSPNDKPIDFSGPDPKWRFFWRMGDRPEHTKYRELNAPQVIPKEFPQWPEEMNAWGSKLFGAINTLAEMLAIGFDIPRDTFARMTNLGPHLLAPTGSDLATYSKPGTVLAGFHTDLNFLTIHGKSRYPGLRIWTKQGKRLRVQIPDGCLLVQAGKQMEWLTGGEIPAGFHEVAVLPETLKAIETQEALGRPLWRVSSTMFFHIASDQILEPLGKFKNSDRAARYPPTEAGSQVQTELGLLKLMA